eukprot:NODE_937_length_1807_cov_31.926621_g824_i0.p1 GENE.NODE_937_length_1807_cov_31.926621_g824_i0~~NODE_937_length_1807_cov_31.926621_g824_i0.p1  ORF type:complete len:365 (+),score=62.20 NODE_937_length_1807_cov_31.926621_g824_i0:679-1773(+)
MWNSEYQQRNPNPVAHLLSHLMINPQFTVAVANQWRSLRRLALSNAAIDQLIERFFQELNGTGAADRNFAVWNWLLGGFVWPNRPVASSFVGEVEFLRHWLVDRTAFLDRAIGDGVLLATNECPEACLHDANCHDFGAFTKCSCKREWTGEHCELPTTDCGGTWESCPLPSGPYYETCSGRVRTLTRVDERTWRDFDGGTDVIAAFGCWYHPADSDRTDIIFDGQRLTWQDRECELAFIGDVCDFNITQITSEMLAQTATSTSVDASEETTLGMITFTASVASFVQREDKLLLSLHGSQTSSALAVAGVGLLSVFAVLGLIGFAVWRNRRRRCQQPPYTMLEMEVSGLDDERCQHRENESESDV